MFNNEEPQESVNAQIIQTSDALQAIIKAETDIQIATAKQYPRDVQRSLKNALTLATMTQESAEACFYSLGRGEKAILGPSARLAEIVANSWGNLRIASRIVGNNGKVVKAQAMCHDLESNVQITVEVERRITTKDGKTFSDDMIVVTGNAASSIARRNAIFGVIPNVLTKHIYDQAKKTAVGDSMTLVERRQNAFAYFAKLGVSADRILHTLQRRTIEAVTLEDLEILLGKKSAIAENNSTIEEAFPHIVNEATEAAKAKSNAATADAMKGINLNKKQSETGKKDKKEEKPAEDPAPAPEPTPTPAPVQIPDYDYVASIDHNVTDNDGDDVFVNMGDRFKFNPENGMFGRDETVWLQPEHFEENADAYHKEKL